MGFQERERERKGVGGEGGRDPRLSEARTRSDGRTESPAARGPWGREEGSVTGWVTGRRDFREGGAA